jgi:HlyD family secretion protein
MGTVALGQEVTFSVDAFPNRQFHGKVAQIRVSPQTLQNVVVYSVMINVDNDDLKLLPGMTATSAIIVANQSDVLRVPNSALRVRVPDSILPGGAARSVAAATGTTSAATSPGTTGAAPAAGTTPAAGRGAAVRDLLREVGIDPKSEVLPAPDLLVRLQTLAKERGIELPERFGGDHGVATLTRTLYTVSGPPEKPVFKAVRVRLGITDGLNTEVLDGLKEGDMVVTSLVDPRAGTTPVSNPFGGGGGPGGPGGFNRR